jgi:hypothetical protein
MTAIQELSAGVIPYRVGGDRTLTYLVLHSATVRNPRAKWEFPKGGMEADETTRADGDCGSWCTVLLLIVLAKVQGTWLLPQGKLKLEQKFQKLTGTLTAGGASAAVEGRLRGDEITFTAGGVTYEGRVNGEIIAGVTKGSQTIAWKAVRKRS